MKKIVFVVALIFFLATMSMASAATNKTVYVRELCRSDEIIIYGIFDPSDNSIIDSLEAKGFLDLIDKLKEYEEKEGIHLIWNYYTKKRTEVGFGEFEINCT
ncbi:MAG: hypothetical protein AMQ74_00569 [Candidatus Methanofastidiosum methylothiophilum]|uniref:Uncharacterized protein n=1 Tax=Candidatus Methanofastidiosum methylothiophilum TaxID=1705564 RepID=A0A150J6U4_9EURY|nr:MAG: hypothetical protein AMQ74_00569 [Candidatus Methanofastidiosum methylthiophilus]NMC76975.1 hypothetical protein [Candidatus Methanofastidiosa archaeon]